MCCGKIGCLRDCERPPRLRLFAYEIRAALGTHRAHSVCLAIGRNPVANMCVCVVANLVPGENIVYAELWLTRNYHIPGEGRRRPYATRRQIITRAHTGRSPVHTSWVRYCLLGNVVSDAGWLLCSVLCRRSACVDIYWVERCALFVWVCVCVCWFDVCGLSLWTIENNVKNYISIST